MTFKAVTSVLEDHMRIAWGDRTPVAFENVSFVPDRTKDPDIEETAWVDFTINYGRGELVGHGALKKMYRQVGVITVGIFTVEGDGTQENKAHCDRVAEIFRGKQFEATNLTCEVPGIIKVGKDRGWFHVNVNIPFYWDDFFTPAASSA